MPVDTATQREFLLDICRNPEDLSLRLIYADFLEDIGQEWASNHSALIRLQYYRHLHEDELNRQKAKGIFEVPNPFDEAVYRSKQISLTNKMCNKWLGPDWPEPLWWRDPMGWIGATLSAGMMNVTWRRGFAESIIIETQAFLDHAEGIFRCQPILHVSLLHRDRTERTLKRRCLDDLIKEETESDMANERRGHPVSRACVRYGRGASGIFDHLPE